MTRTPARDADSRYLLLDGLRGLAAVIIVVHHFTSVSGMHETFASASIAVDFFFCLGGFVIAHAYHERLVAGMPLREYLRLRLHRLYPMFLMGIAIGVVALAVSHTVGATDLSWAGIEEAAFLNTLYMPYLNSNYLQLFHTRITGPIFPLNGPYWSLFFALFANGIYALVIRRSRLAPAILMVVACIWMLSIESMGEAPGWSTRNIVGGFPRVTFAFFAGVVIFQLQPWLKRVPRLHGGLIVAGAVAMLSVPHFRGHVYYWLAATVIAVPMLVILAGRHTSLSGRWSRQLCTFSADMSYPIFCLHYPILILFGATFTEVTHLLFVVYVATSLVAAYMLHRYVERPMRGWLRPRPQPVAQ
ncbi:MAG TPA: acyltransferase [Usitatibacter sp.]|jgi:peptidoglycan/LPS O-acetylase OafA/YrhL|nr:acyltransferase [Usitatibacter sp.]